MSFLGPRSSSMNYLGPLMRAKSEPTTQVTMSEVNWDTVVEPIAQKSEDKGKEKKRRRESVASTDDSSRSGSTKRPHGLLTPHASFGDAFAEEGCSQSWGSRPRTPGSDRDGQTCYEYQRNPRIKVEFSEASYPFDLHVRDNYHLTCPRMSASISVSNSTGHGSYVSVGIQTSFPSSAFPSSASRSPSATPTQSPKRKRPGKPAFIREGERQARELDRDLIFLAQERGRLEREIARVMRRERDLQTLLIPGPTGYPESESEESEAETTDSDADEAARVRARFRTRGPPTPENSEHEMDGIGVRRNRAFPTATASAPTSPSKQSTTSTVTIASAMNASAIESLASSTNRTSNRSALAVPAYTYGEGTSTTGSTYSGERLQRMFEEVLGPPPVCDPASYFIWFDLETNDAVRPARDIRILEVAACVTDKNYTRLDNGISFVVHWPLTAAEVAQEMPQNVREMHERSGLLAAYATTPPDKRLTLEKVEKRVCNYLKKHDIQPNRRGVMAGAGVAFDRGMVRQHMKTLDEYFGHQIFDTTSIWHLVRRKYNRGKRFGETCTHRALDDISGSMREAKMYSDTVLKSPKDVRWPSFRN